MSKYDEMEKEFNYYFAGKNIYIDSMDEDSLFIVSYEDLDIEKLIDIEEQIFWYCNLKIVSIKTRTDEKGTYILVQYKADIGEDIETEEEKYEKSKSEIMDFQIQEYQERKRGL